MPSYAGGDGNAQLSSNMSSWMRNGYNNRAGGRHDGLGFQRQVMFSALRQFAIKPSFKG
jgi:hypothetical protein